MKLFVILLILQSQSAEGIQYSLDSFSDVFFIIELRTEVQIKLDQLGGKLLQQNESLKIFILIILSPA